MLPQHNGFVKSCQTQQLLGNIVAYLKNRPVNITFGIRRQSILSTSAQACLLLLVLSFRVVNIEEKQSGKILRNKSNDCHIGPDNILPWLHHQYNAFTLDSRSYRRPFNIVNMSVGKSVPRLHDVVYFSPYYLFHQQVCRTFVQLPYFANYEQTSK